RAIHDLRRVSRPSERPYLRVAHGLEQQAPGSTQVGPARLGRFQLPISGKPEIGVYVALALLAPLARDTNIISPRRPTVWRVFKSGKVESRRDGAPGERPFAETLCSLPHLRRDNGLRALAGAEIRPKGQSLDRG